MPNRARKRKAGSKRRPAQAVWPVERARAQFARMIERAAEGTPQRITRHGREVAVVLSLDEYRRLAGPKGTLVDFFRQSPLATLTDEEHDRLFARDRTPIGPPIDFS